VHWPEMSIDVAATDKAERCRLGLGQYFEKYRIADIDISASYRIGNSDMVFFDISYCVGDYFKYRYKFFFKVRNNFGYGNVKCSLTVSTFTNFLQNQHLPSP
jgi:hypothetical protein